MKHKQFLTSGGIVALLLLAALMVSNKGLLSLPQAHALGTARQLYILVDVANGSEPHLKNLKIRGRHWHNFEEVAGLQFYYTLNGQPISPTLDAPGNFIWDTSSVPEGYHSLSIQMVDGDNLTYGFPRPVGIGIGNAYSSPNTAHDVWAFPGLASITAGSEFFHTSTATDTINYTGTFKHNTPYPYPYARVAPMHEAPNMTLLADPINQWLGEPLTKTIDDEIQGAWPMFQLDDNGQVFIRNFEQKHTVSKTSEGVFRLVEKDALYDGGRNDNSVSPYSTLVPNPTGPGWFGVDLSGRVYRVDANGTVTTIAGIRTPRDQVPNPNGVKETVGVFDDNLRFRMPVDLTFDPRDSQILYVADTGNNRIAKINLHQNPPVISTYAGKTWSIGTTAPDGGFKDGSALEAVFNRPYSIDMKADGTMYVADRGNHAIRQIVPNGSTVTTVFGKTSTFQDTRILEPQVLRLDSQDRIITSPMAGTPGIYRIDLATQTITLVSNLFGGTTSSTGWVWLDVDVYGPSGSPYGSVGFKDDIYFAKAVGRAPNVGGSPGGIIGRVTADGSIHTQIPEHGTHYGWAVAVDDEEFRVVASGFAGSHGFTQLRPRATGDPAYGKFTDTSQFTPNGQRYVNGQFIHNFGTVAGFPNGLRPGFRLLYSVEGHSDIGSLPFDDLSLLSDTEIAEYIQSGMGGNTPRPEITGNDLRDYIYYIRRNAIQGKVLETVLPGPNHSDTTSPAISNIQAVQIGETKLQVTWTTNEPTLGIVHQGIATDLYHNWSKIEDNYTTNHTVVIDNVTPNKLNHYKVRSKDIAGNQTTSADLTITMGTPTTDTSPPVITDSQAVNLTLDSATITWTTDEPATSQVEYGTTTSYGQTTTKNTSLGNNHSHILSNLNANTTYHARVISTDASGNEARSPDFTFVTTEPLSSQVQAVQSGPWQTSTTWQGGAVPTAEQEAIIPTGITVTYDKAYTDGASSVGATHTIDNGDAGFTLTGSWTQHASGYQGDLRHSTAGSGSDKARWTFDGLTAGTYRVSATWPQHSNRATNSPFTVFDGARALNTVLVNQELAPNDFTAAGVGWENLGDFTIAGSTLAVELTDNANEYVIADAIRIERLGSDTTTDVKSIIVESGGTLTFSRTQSTRLDLAGSLTVFGGGTLDVGTTASPIPANMNAHIGFNVDTDRAFSSSDPLEPTFQDPPLEHLHDWHPEDTGLYAVGDNARITLHGAPKPKIWTRLAADATAGTTTLALQDAPQGWRVGDTILVTSTSTNASEQEKRTITAINGNTLTLNTGLVADHEGSLYAYHKLTRQERKISSVSELQENEVVVPRQAEVALLTQNVTIASNLVTEDDPDRRAHTMMAHGGVIDYQYTELRDLGPRAKFGRYAIHVHKLGAVGSEVDIQGASIWSSVSDPINKWVAIHDTQGVTITDTVGFNAQGRGYLMEDAIEHSNTIEDTLGVLVHAPEELDYTIDHSFPEESSSAAVFWIREGNIYRNNVAVGGGADVAGFWITPNVNPNAPATTIFEGNTAHSNAHGLIYSGVKDLATSFTSGTLWRNTVGLTTGVHETTQAAVRDTVFYQNSTHVSTPSAILRGNTFIPPTGVPNVAPTITVGQNSYDVTIGQLLQFQVKVEDEDGDTVSIEIPELNLKFPVATFE